MFVSFFQASRIFIIVILGFGLFGWHGIGQALTQAECTAQNAELILQDGVCIPKGAFLGLSEGSPSEVLMIFLNWLLGIGGVVAVIAFTISGIQYLGSAGNDNVIGIAKRNMLYSIVGVVVMLSGLIIINFLDVLLSGGSAEPF